MGKLSTEKGKAFERRIAKWMRDLGSRFGGFVRELRETRDQNIGDVYDEMDEYQVVIQCKHMKRPSPFKALKEAKEGAVSRGRHEALGVACIMRDGGEKMVCMDPRLFQLLLDCYFNDFLSWADIESYHSW